MTTGLFKGKVLKRRVMFVTLLLFTLSACTSMNMEANTDDTEWLDLGTEWLSLRIINIYDSPEDSFWNRTISACRVDQSSSCNEVQYVFNHFHLPEIGVTENSFVRVEVPKLRWMPDPAELFVRSWELIN